MTAKPPLVVQLITHFAVGGATEVVISLARRMDQHRFTPLVLTGVTDPSERSLLDRSDVATLDVHEFTPLCRPIRPASDIRCYRQLVTWFRAHRPAIVHTHSTKAGIIGRFAAAKAGVPVIVHTTHGWGHHSLMSPPMRAAIVTLERRAARVTDALVVVSRSNRTKGLADHIGTERQYRVVYCAIDLERFGKPGANGREARRSLGIAPDAPVVGTVGRFCVEKAPHDFAETAALVHRKMPDVRFVFVGGGPLEDEFREDLRRLNLTDTVLAPGYRYDVPDLLHAFDVFFLPSLKEGLPLVIPQAMCAGVPVVATNVDGIPEVVADGDTGFLVEPRDHAAMAGIILELLHKPEMRAEIVEKARRHANANFNDRAMVRSYEAIYADCLAHSKGAPSS